MGRPQKDTEAVLVRLPKGMIEAIDRLRAERSDEPTRPEMIRRILAEWFRQNPD